MERNCETYRAYCQILAQELLPAMGCTEPLSLAYAAAVAAKTLGCRPTAVAAVVSGNIIKNVKSVVVPGTGGGRGIATAVAAGIVLGEPELELQVLSHADPDRLSELQDYLQAVPITMAPAETEHIFDVAITATEGPHSAYVRIVDSHTNIVRIEKDGVPQPLPRSAPAKACAETAVSGVDPDCLTVEQIIDFADSLQTEDVAPVLQRQIDYNMAIAKAGLEGPYGANIGKVLLTYGDDVKIKARAWAAAGSDARMNGCALPVVINSGSGNQGITASVPVVIYAQHYGIAQERLLRALAVSNLCAIHQKTGIGRLSAYCGAVSAGAGAGAGIAYLLGGGYREVAHTLVNALAVVSGIVCDGAKASCAAKIASAVDAGILGYQMFLQGNQFRAGDGIVKKGVENTIRTVGLMAHDGMAATDKEILHLMVDDAPCPAPRKAK